MNESFQLLLEDYRQHLKLERGLSENSLDSYLSDLISFAEAVKGKSPLEITPKEINSYFLALSYYAVTALPLASNQLCK